MLKPILITLYFLLAVVVLICLIRQDFADKRCDSYDSYIYLYLINIMGMFIVAALWPTALVIYTLRMLLSYLVRIALRLDKSKIKHGGI